MFRKMILFSVFLFPFYSAFAQFGNIDGPPMSLSECMAVAEIERVGFLQDGKRDCYNYNITIRIKDDLTKNLRGKSKVVEFPGKIVIRRGLRSSRVRSLSAEGCGVPG